MQLKSKLFYSYLLFVLVYSGFVLLPKPNKLVLAQYHLSTTGVRLIYLTIIILLAAIWYAGFYGYTALHAYSDLIHGDKDGKQVVKLTKGIFLLALWLPVSSVISTILNYFALRHLSLMPAATIINGYVNLVFPLVGFSIIGAAARGLSKLSGHRPHYAITNILLLFNIYIGIIYYRLAATTADRSEIYHLSIWLLLTTLVAPYVYMWSVGLRAAHEIYSYRQRVAGKVYKESWRYLALGIAWLIVTSIAFQYLTVVTQRLRNLSIYWLLALIYSLLLILSVGFVLIAIGTRKLQKIEEV